MKCASSETVLDKIAKTLVNYNLLLRLKIILLSIASFFFLSSSSSFFFLFQENFVHE